jgi:hypothetical protein
MEGSGEIGAIVSRTNSWNRRALLDGIEGVVRRAGGQVATRLRHDIWECKPKTIFGPAAILPSALSGLRQSFYGQRGTFPCGN